MSLSVCMGGGGEELVALNWTVSTLCDGVYVCVCDGVCV